MKRYILILAYLFASKLGYGEMIIDSNMTSPKVNEPFTITVDFINSEKEDYKIDGLDKFQILSKGSQSSYNAINGKVTTKKSDTYLLMPLESGNFTLIAIGKNEKSNSLTIDVKKSSEQSINNANIFLQENKLKKEYYFGEKIPFEENLISTVSIGGLQWIKSPNFDEFSVKDITGTNNQGNYEQELIRIDGKKALKINLFKGILDANSSGEKIISTGQIAVTEDNGMNSFFNQNPPKYLGGDKIKINILPLPEGAPKNFQNIVGNINDETTWSNDTIEYGSAVTLTLKLYGNGNLSSLQRIIPNENKNFTTYETIKDYTANIIDGNFNNTKTVEIAFIPKKIGKLEIPEIIIPYFNTVDKKYENLVIPSKVIEVTGEIPKEDKIAVLNNNQLKDEKKINIEIDQISIKKENTRNIYKLSTFILGILNILQLILLIIFIKKNKNKR